VIDRPFAAPPDIPADRAKALQDAFVAVHKDAQYLEETHSLKIDVSPINSEEVMRVIARMEAEPPETLDYMRKLFANKGSE
jgi:hypothetical protein